MLFNFELELVFTLILEHEWNLGSKGSEMWVIGKGSCNFLWWILVAVNDILFLPIIFYENVLEEPYASYKQFDINSAF